MMVSILHRLRALFQKDRLEQELDAELQFHLEMEIEQNIRRGLGPTEARYAALRSFGGVDQIKEQCRENRGILFLETLNQDVRYGLRMLSKRPGYTIIALIVLALGIGVNTAIFSVIYGVLLRPLPYLAGEQLVILRQQAPALGVERMGFSPLELADYRAQAKTFAGLVEYHNMSFILLGRTEPERVQTGVVSAEFFDFLGLKPLLGRTFLPGEDQSGAAPVLVLSYDYWQRSHGGDPSVVGQKFQMNDREHTVIGVLPPVPQYPVENDVYMPVSACPFRSAESATNNRSARMINVFGRLKPEVTREEAAADLATVASRLHEQYPQVYAQKIGYKTIMAPLQEELTRQAKPKLLILLVTAGLVLLIACANVASLTLAHLICRERELAVRAVLGAGRRRLLRQLLTESTLLALAGGVLGLLFAAGGLQLLISFAGQFTPRASEITIDSSVLLFTLVVSVATGLIFGAIPAFTAEQNLFTAMKGEIGPSRKGPGRQRVRSLLLISQVAVSFILLITAGLMLRSLIKLHQVDPGFNPENVLAMEIDLNWSKYRASEERRSFYEPLLEKIQAQPGVLSAAVSYTYPLSQTQLWSDTFLIEGEPEGAPPHLTDVHVVSPAYFQTIGIPFLRGRSFTGADEDNSAVINQSLARHRWGEKDPVGQRISLNNGKTWFTIVGVVGDVKYYGLDRETTDEIYLPFLWYPPLGASFLVRTASEPLSIAELMRQAVYSVDPQQPLDKVETLEQARAASLATPRLLTLLLGLFAALALIITVSGISGVIALSVNQRRYEIGVRLALGATPGGVMRLVLRQGMRLVLVGLAVGLGAALLLTKPISVLLFGVTPTDPVTFLAVSLVVIATAALACFLPARRVTRIDPMTALRTD